MNKSNSKNNSKKNKSLKSAILKFVLIMLASFVVGGVFGFFVAMAEDKGVDFGAIFNNIDNYAIYAMPWLFVAILIVGGGLCLAYYLKAKKDFAKWNGEDEDSISKVELMLSKVAVISNIALILDYFFISAWLHFSVSDTVTVSDKMLIINSIICIVAFLVVLVFAVIIQRAVVELVKKINPEKRGEVLDNSFQKDWEASFDEAEKIMAGKAAFKSFKVTNATCLILWLLSIIGQVMFDIGIVPALFVTIIWLVSTVSYQVEAMKLETKR